MADEPTETEAHSEESEGASGTNGKSSSFADRLAADRAAFMAHAGDEGGDKKSDKANGKTDAKSDKAKVDAVVEDDEDDDSDLDDDQVDEETKDDDEEVESKDDKDSDGADGDDDDSDLDEEKKDDKDVDASTKKRLDQVRTTDKRLRERRDADFKAQEQRLQQFESNIEKAWRPRIEKAEKFEKLAARARTHTADVLLELGLTDEDLEHAARDIYAHSKKGSEDPKNKEAALRARLVREQAEEVKALRKRLDEKDETEKKSKEEAEQRKAVDGHLDRFAAAAKKTDRYPLAKSYLAKDPQSARAELEVVAGRLAQQLGAMPDPNDVIKAFEKDRRRVLRAHGLDPKKLYPSASSATATEKADTDTKKKPTPKNGDKTTAEKPTVKRLTKADYIAGKFD